MEYMKIGTDTKERLKRIIRDAVALDPMISLRELQALLLKRNIKMGNLNSLAKLRKEITAEAVEESDRKQVIERFAEMSERSRLMQQQLWKVIFPSDTQLDRPTLSEQMLAMRTIASMDAKLLKAGIEMGVYRKDMLPGKKYTEEEEFALRNQPLPPEIKASIRWAFENWGFVPRNEEV